ncbi:MAG: hypothetical protein ACRCS0_11030 [Albidovulum sp.]
MNAVHRRVPTETYLLFVSDAVILQDIAEEIGLQRPGAAIQTVGTLEEFMSAILPASTIRAVFVELELLGPYWTMVRDRLREFGARIVLLGNAVEDMADQGLHLDGAVALQRPYSASDVARHIADEVIG